MLKLNHLIGFGVAAPIAAPPPAPDPYYAYVVRLIQPSDSASVVADIKGNPVTNSGVTLSAGDAPVAGVKAMVFDGSAAYLVMPGSPDFNLTGDFTLEFWVKPTAFGDVSGYQRRIFTSYPDDNFFEVMIRTGYNDYIANYASGGVQPVTSALTLNVWNHVVMERKSGTIALALDGVFAVGLVKSATLSASTGFYVGCHYLGVGNGGAGSFAGLLGGLRLTRGVARYGLTNFTRPSAAFPTS